MRLKIVGLLAAAASVFMAPAAFAADMPAKMAVKAPMAAATPWTGFYVNGGVGYGAWAADQTTIATATGACVMCETQVFGGKGWLATIGAGYDYQFTSNFVAGLFGDASISSLKGSIEDRNPGLGYIGDIKQTSSWAVGARAGFLVTPKTLSYWNGGFTSARFSGADMIFNNTGLPAGESTPAFTANGWFLGGGVETSLMPGWFWRTEYRYSYFNSKTLNESPASGLGITFKPTVQTVNTQIVYKFNGGMAAPVYPATPAMATNWTGFYANAGTGYGIWSADSLTNALGAGCVICANHSVGGKGYLGTIGAGYDWQIAPVWVAGISGNFDISRLKGTIQDEGTPASGTIKQTSSWAVGPRFGWLPSPQTLTYVNGGYTSARFSGADFVLMTTGAPTGVSTPAFTTTGWFAGGGVETTFEFMGFFGKGWFWRNEYRYASYRDKTVTETGGAPNRDITFKPVVQTVTSSIVFKLN